MTDHEINLFMLGIVVMLVLGSVVLFVTYLERGRR